VIVGFRDSSIAKKLTWMNMLVSGAALLLASIAFASYGLISHHDTIIRNLNIQAQIVGANSVSALLFNDPQAAGKTLAALSGSPNIVCAGIYNLQGELLADYWRDGKRRSLPRTPALQTQFHYFGDEGIIVAHTIVFQGAKVGTVLIQSDLKEVVELVEKYAIIVAAVLLVSLAAALILSFFIRRNIAEPIMQLAETARTVSRDKIYSVRAPTTKNRDELAILIGTFNEMLGQIEAGDAALREAHDSLELRVQHRTAQLDAVNKELEAFSYSVSHDLRAPLRQVDGFSKILGEEYGPQLDPGAQRYLKLIRDGARNMGQLVDDLLKLARIGRQELDRKPADLNWLLQNALQDLEPECRDRQIDWRIGQLPVVPCDVGLMKQVFANLLSNAVKYTRHCEKAIIEVGQSTGGDMPVIFVRDNGAGFDQQYVHKLFGVFQRLHRMEEFEGTGVGLATVQRIVQKHGGRIWAEAAVGKGATFSFSLAAKSLAANCQDSIEATKSVSVGR
jgi:signal transduction histidine kinase